MVRRSLISRILGRWKDDSALAGRVTGGRSTTDRDKAGFGNGSGPASNGDGPEGKESMSTDPGSKTGVKAVPVERMPDQTSKDKGFERRPEAREVKSTKMAPQEELSLKVSEGLASLTDLLGRIDDKLLSQNKHGLELARKLDGLPRLMNDLAETQKTNLEVLREVRTTLTGQAKSTKDTAESVGRIPGLIDGLGGKVDRQSRAGEKLGESVDTVGKSVRTLADSSQRAHNTLVAEFRRAQDEHRRRLEDVVRQGRRTSLIVAFLGVLVVGGLVAVVLAQTGVL